MGTARPDLWSVPRLLGLAVVVGLLAGAADLHATPMVFEITNHPDGVTIGVNINVDGNVLRLKLNSTAFDGGDNGFNVNTAAAARGLTGSARFSFDPTSGDDPAALAAFAFDNEAGGDSNGFDGGDDFYKIVASLNAIDFTDPNTLSPWRNGHTKNVEYDKMIGDLLLDANNPNTGAENTESFTTDAARIYYKVSDVTLTAMYDTGEGFEYVGPIAWDEYPNDETKPFFIQFCWRLGSDCSKLAGAGWLEPGPDRAETRAAPEDLLYQYGRRIPEPASLAIFGLALAAVAYGRRRRAA